MRRSSRSFLSLLLVAVLALALTLLLSGGGARAMFQDSPVSTPTPQVPTLPPPGTELPTVVPVATLEPPTSVPLPATAGPTPTPRGFLPAPTIVNPDDVRTLPLAQPPVSGGSEPDATAAPPTPSAATTARVVVELINYVWLLCGGALLIGGAVAITLIWRRGRRT